MARDDPSPRASAAPGGPAGVAAPVDGEESRLLALAKDESREFASSMEVIDMPRPPAPIGAYVMLAAAVRFALGGRGWRGGDVEGKGVPGRGAVIPRSGAPR